MQGGQFFWAKTMLLAIETFVCGLGAIYQAQSLTKIQFAQLSTTLLSALEDPCGCCFV